MHYKLKITALQNSRRPQPYIVTQFRTNFALLLRNSDKIAAFQSSYLDGAKTMSFEDVLLLNHLSE